MADASDSELLAQFARKGSEPAFAAASVAANSLQAASASMAKEISILALAKGTSATATTTALVKATMKTMMRNKIKRMITAGATALLTVGTATLLAQHPDKSLAKIPYKMLEDAWLFQQAINPTNLAFHIVIVSSKKGVDPKDIHLTIPSAAQGNIPVRLGDKGMLLDFPCDDALRRDNPFVISDQPKGTLRMGLWVHVPRPEGLRFHYDHLANAVDEANKAAVRANQIAKSDYGETRPMFSGTINGIGLHFPSASAGKANVTIASKDRPKNYVADAHGVIVLKINPKLKAENPELIFSQRPDWIGIQP